MMKIVRLKSSCKVLMKHMMLQTICMTCTRVRLLNITLVSAKACQTFCKLWEISMVMKEVVEVMRRTKSQKVKKEVKAKVLVPVLVQARKALTEKNASSSEKQIHDTYSILAHFRNLTN